MSETREKLKEQISLEGGTWSVELAGDDLLITDASGRTRHQSRGRMSAGLHLAMALAKQPFESSAAIDGHLIYSADKWRERHAAPQPEQPASEKPAVDSNVESVVAKHRQRAALGLKKYGVTTERTDLTGAEWLQHLQDELMDAAVYVQALLAQPSEPTATPSASWCIQTPEGRVLIRDKGKVVYDGLEADMPDEMRKLAAEFTVDFKDAAPVLLGEPAATDAPTEAGIDLPTEPGMWERADGEWSVLVKELFSHVEKRIRLVAVGFTKSITVDFRYVDDLPRGGWSRAVRSSEVAGLREENADLKRVLRRCSVAAAECTGEESKDLPALSEAMSIPPETADDFVNSKVADRECRLAQCEESLTAARETIERQKKELKAVSDKRSELLKNANSSCDSLKEQLRRVDAVIAQRINIETRFLLDDTYMETPDFNASDALELFRETTSKFKDKLTAAEAEVARLKGDVEQLRIRLLSAAGDDLCRLSQEEIKAYTSGAVQIPPKEEFIASCERFHEQIAMGPGVLSGCLTLAQLVAENEKLKGEVERLTTVIHIRPCPDCGSLTDAHSAGCVIAEFQKRLGETAKLPVDPYQID